MIRGGAEGGRANGEGDFNPRRWGGGGVGEKRRARDDCWRLVRGCGEVRRIIGGQCQGAGLRTTFGG